MAKTKKVSDLTVLKNAAMIPEKFSAASESRAACRACKLFDNCDSPFVTPLIPEGYTGKLMIITEKPEYGEAISGEVHKLLRRMWRKVGFADHDVAVVPAVRCQPIKSRIPSVRQVRGCRSFVLRAIRKLRPQYVLATGKAGIIAVTNDGKSGNITKSRGRLLRIPGNTRETVAFGTFSPSGVVAGNVEAKPRILRDLRRFTEPFVNRPARMVPKAEYVSFDAEWSPDGKLLTMGVADARRAISEEK